MLNRFRINLGFLPQHLPQQINFVTWKAKGARAESEPRNDAVGRCDRVTNARRSRPVWGGDV
jgi:hypothetical protein